MAKLFALLFFPLFLFHQTFSQDTIAMKAALVKKIQQYQDYPNPHNGKEEWTAIDQIRRLSTLNDFYQYAHDSSVILRFIGFTSLLQQDSDHIFELLKEYIHDSTAVFIIAPSCTPGYEYHYNRLIAEYYYTYLSYGFDNISGTFGKTYDHLVFVTDPQKKKIYRHRKRELELFLETSGYSAWIKYWKSTERELRKM